MSNQFRYATVAHDFIKRKVYGLTRQIRFPVLGFFILKPYFLAKPFTNGWELIRRFYKERGGREIRNKVVVSNEGGLVVEKTYKSGPRKGETEEVVQTTDLDRAYAHNIGAKFYAIEEYLDPEVQIPFRWDEAIPPPELRALYFQVLAERSKGNPNIFKELRAQGTQDTYVIMIMGPPRSGKTRLATQLLTKWRSSKFGESNKIVHMEIGRPFTKKRREKQFQKALKDRFSVLLDGGLYTKKLRRPFVKIMAAMGLKGICIEMNCGMRISELFNWVAVQTAGNEETLLYKRDRFRAYNGVVDRPLDSPVLKHLVYYPVIEHSPAIDTYRY